MKYKDPVTGEFKELYTKAADTLPVGTVVDYDGDEVPAGWEEVEDEVVLFEDSGGSNENITLDKNITSDVKYIDILFRDDDNVYSFVRVYEPIGKLVDLHIVRINKSYHFRVKYSMISISNNTLTISDYGVHHNGVSEATNVIYITKVIGYR